MCEFCTKHGEGKKWYEVMENYSTALLAETRRQAYINRFVPSIHNASLKLDKLETVKRKYPLAYRFISKMGTQQMKKNHFGQVVPIEDAEKIIDLVQSITRIACICRKIKTGESNHRYCLLLGIDPTGIIKEWPELQYNLETLNKIEAKKLLREFDREGLVHSIWTFKTPFIGAICNCDHDCLAFRLQVSSGLLNVMFKAEYIAEIDPVKCVGCRECQKLCQFGAIQYSVTNHKCYINPLQCYGCGVCRVGCKKDAVNLLLKEELPNFKHLW
ncbi:MAG: 4Fe-4S ferredoxin [Peptococcaceae bacterium BRH_c8a]|nr:MAG: 4Fe-4S ferredoxin [Peptococcaceae bacterium BRH_c8a]